MQPFTLSKHATQRALEMELKGEEIYAAMMTPRDVARAGIGKEKRTHGRVTCVVALDGFVPVVTTVLWARMSDWIRDEESTLSRGYVGDQDKRNRTRYQIDKRRKRRGHHAHRGNT